MGLCTLKYDYILEMKSRLGDHHIWGPEHKKQTPALEHIYLDQQLKTFQTDCKKSCVNFFLHFYMFSSISFWHVTDLCLGQFEGHNIINVQPLLFLLIFISLSFYSLFVPGEGNMCTVPSDNICSDIYCLDGCLNDVHHADWSISAMLSYMQCYLCPAEKILRIFALYAAVKSHWVSE